MNASMGALLKRIVPITRQRSFFFPRLPSGLPNSIPSSRAPFADQDSQCLIQQRGMDFRRERCDAISLDPIDYLAIARVG
jgi:hypothetical protein